MTGLHVILQAVAERRKVTRLAFQTSSREAIKEMSAQYP